MQRTTHAWWSCLWGISLFICCQLYVSCHNFQSYKPPVEENAEAESSFYNSALQNLESGNLPSALTDLDSALYYNPGFANYHRLRGWVFEQMGESDSAIAAYETSVRLKSNFPEVWRVLGSLYLQQNEADKSAFYLKKATTAYPDSLSIHLLLSEAYIAADKGQLALDILRAYEREHFTADAAFFKWEGIAHHSVGNYEKSVESLTRYSKVVPDDVVAIKHLGIATFEFGDYDQAISHLNRAWQLRPEDAEVYLYRARYFEQVGKPDIAIEQLEFGLQQDADNAALLYDYSVALFTAGRLSTAEQQLDRLISVDAEHWPAFKFLGLIAEAREEWGMAQQYYQTYIDHTLKKDADVQARLEAVNKKLPQN